MSYLVQEMTPNLITASQRNPSRSNPPRCIIIAEFSAL